MVLIETNCIFSKKHLSFPKKILKKRAGTDRKATKKQVEEKGNMPHPHEWTFILGHHTN